jgi:antitoxin (DNA-binding transcriptional repressor) of toxin-antitoxin stability system
MAVVKMRDLLRKPGDVFNKLEATREPVLVTRNGEAIAALFPVDPQQAAQTALAALPEFVESRRRAEHARREGRTRSQEEVTAELAARQEDAEESPTDAHESIVREIKVLFGDALAVELASEVDAQIAVASEPVVRAVVAAGHPTPETEEGADTAHETGESTEEWRDEVLLRIHQSTGRLIVHLLAATLPSVVSDRLATRPVDAIEEHQPEPDPGGILGKPLAEETLEAATRRARWFNSKILESGERESFSLPVYEAYIKGVADRGLSQRTETRISEPVLALRRRS